MGVTCLISHGGEESPFSAAALDRVLSALDKNAGAAEGLEGLPAGLEN
jgi:hypothetical protein